MIAGRDMETPQIFKMLGNSCNDAIPLQYQPYRAGRAVLLQAQALLMCRMPICLLSGNSIGIAILVHRLQHRRC